MWNRASRSNHFAQETVGIQLSRSVDSMEYIVVFNTCPDKGTAEKIARCLVESNLAACVSISDGIASIYRWQGEICRDNEVLLIIKAKASNYNALEQKIKSLHPYEIPEIIALPIISGSQEYLDWLKG